MRVTELANKEKISKEAIRSWIRNGYLKASVEPTGYVIQPADWENFKNQCSVKMTYLKK